MFLLAIDPHVKQCAIAVFKDRKLFNIKTVNTNELISIPEFEIHITPGKEFHLVIERPWIGKNPKGSITLAITVGKIMGSLIRSGFEVHEAPAWGVNGSWIADMLSTGNRIPTTLQVKKLSMQIAKAEYPDFDIDEHAAAAILMGMWWIKKRRMEG